MPRVLNQNTDIVQGAQNQSADQCNPQLLPDDLQRVLHADFMQRQRPDNQRAGLRACITARVGQHRDKCDQYRNCRQRILEFPENSAGDHVRHHQHDQPDNPVTDHPDDGCLQVWRLLGGGSGHLLEVFRSLLCHDINGIIDRDDTNQPVLRIQHGHRCKVIAVKQLRRVLPVLRRMNRDDILCHDVADLSIPLAQKHLTDCDNTQQFLGGVRHITGVEILTVLAIRTDPADRLHDRHVRAQPDILSRHDRSGAVLRIFQQSVDVLAVFRSDLAQHPAHNIGRHLLQHVNSVIRVHLRQDILDFLIGKIIQEFLLLLRLHLAEGIGGLILGQNPEQDDPFLIRELRQDLRDVNRLHVIEGFLQPCNIMFCKKSRYPLYSLFNCHILSFSFNFLLNQIP